MSLQSHFVGPDRGSPAVLEQGYGGLPTDNWLGSRTTMVPWEDVTRELERSDGFLLGDDVLGAALHDHLRLGFAESIENAHDVGDGGEQYVDPE